jgi:hypothetical protein
MDRRKNRKGYEEGEERCDRCRERLVVRESVSVERDRQEGEALQQRED